MVQKNLTGKAIAAVAALTLTVSGLGQSAAVFGGNTVKAAGSDNYAKLLQESLFFYDTNMCGKQVE
ncbi:MAG: hypothetical protein J6P89_06535, partial [Oscillospiraceae bacterium]|nr:hypothetical protein [Oscillospiraceae bacterium]